ncbi:MAG: delta24(24(1))-sterol reductase [Hyphomicrobiaceae bacterium]|jgi:delta24(24(1))-sterol reductase
MTKPGISKGRTAAAPPTIDAEETSREFGGTLGATLIMLASHGLLLYLWLAWRFHDGALFYPAGLSDIGPFFHRMWEQLASHATPSLDVFAMYWGFLVVEGLMAAYIPGIEIKGLPIPNRGGKQLVYRCNGIYAWWITLIAMGVLHVTGIFPLQTLYDRFGSFMVVSIISANLVAVAVHFGALITGNAERMTGSFIYDFFMGAWLNPRIGPLDLKMWAEVRVSWLMLFLLTASAAAHQYEVYGVVSTPMLFMVLAHWLYTNACMKGEECIPTTWDIFYEKWGWMLVFWNLAGVSFLYCFNSMYIASRPPFEHSLPFTIFVFALLLAGYFIWDTAQAQRNRFRMQINGSYVKRKAFPQLPWATLENPRYLETKAGSKLLIDGWWGKARKIHYTADVMMALSWGLICGFQNFLPYLYVSFFIVMILHRANRDIERCEKKYGEDWERYRKEVPYLFIPYVY